jgi:peptide/nickel transport system ATP-binding protein
VPAPNRLPPGCIFEPRCQYAKDACRNSKPALNPLSTNSAHLSRCIFAEEIDATQWMPPTVSPASLPEAEGSSPLRKEARGDGTFLRVTDLKTHYRHGGGALGLGKKEFVKAVDGVSFDLIKGKTLGIVGESGSGKSTLVKTIIGLEDVSGGSAEFVGFDISKRTSKRDLDLIKELQMVFQNPDATMNPAYSVGQQIERPLRRFNVVPKDQIRDEVIRLLRSVKLDEHYYDRLPRQLSGGEKQRIGIARAFAGRPDLVLADEPVSALDVSVQAAVLNLLMEIQSQRGTTMIFIAHDLSVVRYFCDYIAVMYLGQIMEIGPASAIYNPPYHPYTESLLAAVPVPDPSVEQSHIRLQGSVPSPLNPPSGCRFHTRCPRRTLAPEGGLICEQKEPPWQAKGDGHQIYCHIPLEVLQQMEPAVKMTASNSPTSTLQVS